MTWYLRALTLYLHVSLQEVTGLVLCAKKFITVCLFLLWVLELYIWEISKY